ncbi:hypothetical protein FGG78_15645 [Thioclava sp. BHET1]|nr:hypothetical protein FGG78_15645 [Thioclava sp. BHET1]
MFQDYHEVERDLPLSSRAANAAFPLEAALRELQCAAHDLAFAETADLISDNRVVMLDGMIRACQADAARSTAEEAEALWSAAASLSEERAELAETLPLEHAFHADQKDLARARMRASQRRLRSWLHLSCATGCAAPGFDPNIAPDEARALVREALALTPEEVSRRARFEARARLYEISAGDEDAPLDAASTQCAARIAVLLVARARDRLEALSGSSRVREC